MVINFGPVVVSVLLVTISAVARSQGVSEITNWRSTPVAVESMNLRLRKSAENDAQHGRTARMGLCEIAYPESVAEFNSLNGYAVLMVTGIVHRPEMLPIRRVFAQFDGKRIDLVEIKAIYSKNSNSADLMAKVYGQYRVDALYLMPIFIRSKRGTASVEFRSDKGAALMIEGFDGRYEKKLPDTEPTTIGPSQVALEAFIAKRFPAFVEK